MKGHLIVLALAGEASARQLARVEKWRREERGNEERWGRRERLWNLIGQVDRVEPRADGRMGAAV